MTQWWLRRQKSDVQFKLFSITFYYYNVKLFKWREIRNSDLRSSTSIFRRRFSRASRNIRIVKHLTRNDEIRSGCTIASGCVARNGKRRNHRVPSHLSSQKVHGVCNGLAEFSSFWIALMASSDNTGVFNRSVEVPSFASHSAAAMFETTVQQRYNVTKIMWWSPLPPSMTATRWRWARKKKTDSGGIRDVPEIDALRRVRSSKRSNQSRVSNQLNVPFYIFTEFIRL